MWLTRKLDKQKKLITCHLHLPFFCQVRKTLDATMQTLQDMLTVEDFDVSDAFQHSRSTESIKSVASESYMNKLNVAKRRANQQETETFYFSVRLHLPGAAGAHPPPTSKDRVDKNRTQKTEEDRG